MASDARSPTGNLVGVSPVAKSSAIDASLTGMTSPSPHRGQFSQQGQRPPFAPNNDRNQQGIGAGGTLNANGAVAASPPGTGTLSVPAMSPQQRVSVAASSFSEAAEGIGLPALLQTNMTAAAQQAEGSPQQTPGTTRGQPPEAMTANKTVSAKPKPIPVQDTSTAQQLAYSPPPPGQRTVPPSATVTPDRQVLTRGDLVKPTINMSAVQAQIDRGNSKSPGSPTTAKKKPHDSTKKSNPLVPAKEVTPKLNNNISTNNKSGVAAGTSVMPSVSGAVLPAAAIGVDDIQGAAAASGSAVPSGVSEKHSKTSGTINSSNFSVVPFTAPSGGRLVKRHQERAGCLARTLYLIFFLLLVIGAVGMACLLQDHSFNPLVRSKKMLFTYRMYFIGQRASGAVSAGLPKDGVWVPPTTSTSNLTVDSGTTAYTDLFSHASYIQHVVDDIYINLTKNPNSTLYAVDDNDFRNRHSGPDVDRIRYNSLMRAYATRSQQLRRDRIDRANIRLISEMSLCTRAVQRVGSLSLAGGSRRNLPHDVNRGELLSSAGIHTANEKDTGFAVASYSHRYQVSCLVDPDDPIVEYFAVTRTRPQDKGPAVPLSSSATASSDPSNRLNSISFLPSLGTHLVSEAAVSVLSLQQYRGLCMQKRMFALEEDGAAEYDSRRYRAANRPLDSGRSYATRRVPSPGDCGDMPAFGGGNSLFGNVKVGSASDMRVDGTNADFVGYRGVPVRGVSGVDMNTSIGLAALVDADSISGMVAPVTDSYFSGITNPLYLLRRAVLSAPSQRNPPMWLVGNVDVEVAQPESNGNNVNSFLLAWQARMGLQDPDTPFGYSNERLLTYHDSRKNWQLKAALWLAIIVVITVVLFIILWESYLLLSATYHRADVRKDVQSGDYSVANQLERLIDREYRHRKHPDGILKAEYNPESGDRITGFGEALRISNLRARLARRERRMYTRIRSNSSSNILDSASTAMTAATTFSMVSSASAETDYDSLTDSDRHSDAADRRAHRASAQHIRQRRSIIMSVLFSLAAVVLLGLGVGMCAYAVVRVQIRSMAHITEAQLKMEARQIATIFSTTISLTQNESSTDSWGEEETPAPNRNRTTPTSSTRYVPEPDLDLQYYLTASSDYTRSHDITKRLVRALSSMAGGTTLLGHTMSIVRPPAKYFAGSHPISKIFWDAYQQSLNTLTTVSTAPATLGNVTLLPPVITKYISLPIASAEYMGTDSADSSGQRYIQNVDLAYEDDDMNAVPSHALDYLFGSLRDHREVSGVSQFDLLPHKCEKLELYDGPSHHGSYQSLGSTAYAAVYLPGHSFAVFVVARTEMVMDGPGIGGIVFGIVAAMSIIFIILFVWFGLATLAPFGEGSVLLRRYGPATHSVRLWYYGFIFFMLLGTTVVTCYYGDGLRTRAAVAMQQKMTSVFTQMLSSIGHYRNIDADNIVSQIVTPSDTEILQFSYPTDGYSVDVTTDAQMTTATTAADISTSALFSSTSDASRMLTSTSVTYSVIVQSPERIQALSIGMLATIAELFDASGSLGIAHNYYAPSILLDTPTPTATVVKTDTVNQQSSDPSSPLSPSTTLSPSYIYSATSRSYINDPTTASITSTAAPTESDNPLKLRIYGKRKLRYTIPAFNASQYAMYNATRMGDVQVTWSISSAVTAGVAASSSSSESDSANYVSGSSYDDASAVTSLSNTLKAGFRTKGKNSVASTIRSIPNNWENWYTGAAMSISRVSAILPAVPTYFTPIADFSTNITIPSRVITAMVATAAPDIRRGHRGIAVQRLTSESDLSSASRSSSLSPSNSGGASSTASLPAPSSMISLVQRVPLFVSILSMFTILGGVFMIAVVLFEGVFMLIHKARVAPVGTKTRDAYNDSSSDSDSEAEDSMNPEEREVKEKEKAARQRVFNQYFDPHRTEPWYALAAIAVIVSVVCMAFPLSGLVIQKEVTSAISRTAASEVKWVLESSRDVVEQIANDAVNRAAKMLIAEQTIDARTGWWREGNITTSASGVNSSRYRRRTWALSDKCMTAPPSRITNAALYRSLLLAMSHVQGHTAAALPFAVSWRLLIQNRTDSRAKGAPATEWISFNPERALVVDIPNTTAINELGLIQQRFSRDYKIFLANHTAFLKAQLNATGNNATNSSSSTSTSQVPTITEDQAQQLRNYLLYYRKVSKDYLMFGAKAIAFPTSVKDFFAQVSSVPHVGRFDVVEVPGLTAEPAAVATKLSGDKGNGRIHLNSDNSVAEFSTIFTTPVTHQTAVDQHDLEYASSVVPSCPRCSYAAIRLRIGLKAAACTGTVTDTRVLVGVGSVNATMESVTVTDLNDEDELSFALLLAVDTSSAVADAAPHSTSFLSGPASEESAFKFKKVAVHIGEVCGAIFVMLWLVSLLSGWYVVESVRHHEEDMALELLADAIHQRRKQRRIRDVASKVLLSLRTEDDDDELEDEEDVPSSGKGLTDSEEGLITAALSGVSGNASSTSRHSEPGGITSTLPPNWKDIALELVYPRGEPFAFVDQSGVGPAACRGDIPIETVVLAGSARTPSSMPHKFRKNYLIFAISIPLAIAAVTSIMQLWFMAALIYQRELVVSGQHGEAGVHYYSSPFSSYVSSNADACLAYDGMVSAIATNEAVFLGNVAPMGRSHGGVAQTTRSASVSARMKFPASHSTVSTLYNFRDASLESSYTNAMAVLTTVTAAAANGNNNGSRSSRIPDDLDSFVLASAVTVSPFINAMARSSWSPLLQPTSTYPSQVAVAQSEVSATESTGTFASPVKQQTLAELQCGSYNDCFFNILRRQWLTHQVQEQGGVFASVKSIRSRYFTYLNAMPSMVVETLQTTLNTARNALVGSTTTTTRATTSTSRSTQTSTTTTIPENATVTSTAAPDNSTDAPVGFISSDSIMNMSAHSSFLTKLTAVEDLMRRLQLLDHIYLEAGMFPNYTNLHIVGNWTVSYSIIGNNLSNSNLSNVLGDEYILDRFGVRSAANPIIRRFGSLFGPSESQQLLYGTHLSVDFIAPFFPVCLKSVGKLGMFDRASLTRASSTTSASIPPPTVELRNLQARIDKESNCTQQVLTQLVGPMAFAASNRALSQALAIVAELNQPTYLQTLINNGSRFAQGDQVLGTLKQVLRAAGTAEDFIASLAEAATTSSRTVSGVWVNPDNIIAAIRTSLRELSSVLLRRSCAIASFNAANHAAWAAKVEEGSLAKEAMNGASQTATTTVADLLGTSASTTAISSAAAATANSAAIATATSATSAALYYAQLWELQRLRLQEVADRVERYTSSFTQWSPTPAQIRDLTLAIGGSVHGLPTGIQTNEQASSLFQTLLGDGSYLLANATPTSLLRSFLVVDTEMRAMLANMVLVETSPPPMSGLDEHGSMLNGAYVYSHRLEREQDALRTPRWAAPSSFAALMGAHKGWILATSGERRDLFSALETLTVVAAATCCVAAVVCVVAGIISSIAGAAFIFKIANEKAEAAPSSAVRRGKGGSSSPGNSGEYTEGNGNPYTASFNRSGSNPFSSGRGDVNQTGLRENSVNFNPLLRTDAHELNSEALQRDADVRLGQQEKEAWWASGGRSMMSSFLKIKRPKTKKSIAGGMLWFSSSKIGTYDDEELTSLRPKNRDGVSAKSVGVGGGLGDGAGKDEDVDRGTVLALHLNRFRKADAKRHELKLISRINNQQFRRHAITSAFGGFLTLAILLLFTGVIHAIVYDAVQNESRYVELDDIIDSTLASIADIRYKMLLTRTAHVRDMATMHLQLTAVSVDTSVFDAVHVDDFNDYMDSTLRTIYGTRCSSYRPHFCDTFARSDYSEVNPADGGSSAAHGPVLPPNICQLVKIPLGLGNATNSSSSFSVMLNNTAYSYRFQCPRVIIPRSSSYGQQLNSDLQSLVVVSSQQTAENKELSLVAVASTYEVQNAELLSRFPSQQILDDALGTAAAALNTILVATEGTRIPTSKTSPASNVKEANGNALIDKMRARQRTTLLILTQKLTDISAGMAQLQLAMREEILQYQGAVMHSAQQLELMFGTYSRAMKLVLDDITYGYLNHSYYYGPDTPINVTSIKAGEIEKDPSLLHSGIESASLLLQQIRVQNYALNSLTGVAMDALFFHRNENAANTTSVSEISNLGESFYFNLTDTGFSAVDAVVSTATSTLTASGAALDANGVPVAPLNSIFNTMISSPFVLDSFIQSLIPLSPYIYNDPHQHAYGSQTTTTLAPSATSNSMNSNVSTYDMNSPFGQYLSYAVRVTNFAESRILSNFSQCIQRYTVLYGAGVTNVTVPPNTTLPNATGNDTDPSTTTTMRSTTRTTTRTTTGATSTTLDWLDRAFVTIDPDRGVVITSDPCSAIYDSLFASFGVAIERLSLLDTQAQVLSNPAIATVSFWANLASHQTSTWMPVVHPDYSAMLLRSIHMDGPQRLAMRNEATIVPSPYTSVNDMSQPSIDAYWPLLAGYSNATANTDATVRNFARVARQAVQDHFDFRPPGVASTNITVNFPKIFKSVRALRSYMLGEKMSRNNVTTQFLDSLSPAERLRMQSLSPYTAARSGNSSSIPITESLFMPRFSRRSRFVDSAGNGRKWFWAPRTLLNLTVDMAQLKMATRLSIPSPFESITDPKEVTTNATTIPTSTTSTSTTTTTFTTSATTAQANVTQTTTTLPDIPTVSVLVDATKVDANTSNYVYLAPFRSIQQVRELYLRNRNYRSFTPIVSIEPAFLEASATSKGDGRSELNFYTRRFGAIAELLQNTFAELQRAKMLLLINLRRPIASTDDFNDAYFLVPRAEIGNEGSSRTTRYLQDRHTLLRSWFDRQLSTLAVGGGDILTSSTTYKTAGPVSGLTDVIYSPSQIHTAQILWRRRSSPSTASPPGLEEVLQSAGANPFSADQKYFTTGAQKTLLRLVGTDGIDSTTPNEGVNLQSQSALLKEIILWLTVVVPSAFSEPHTRTDTTGCTLTVATMNIEVADASDISPVFATLSPATSFSSAVDLNFEGAAFSCSTTAALSLEAEQQILQLVDGYAATVYHYDDTDMNDVNSDTAATSDSDASDLQSLSGYSWFDSVLSTHSSIANLVTSRPRQLLLAAGLQAGFRLVQWLAILMLWGIGGVCAWMYYRMGLHQG